MKLEAHRCRLIVKFCLAVAVLLFLSAEVWARVGGGQSYGGRGGGDGGDSDGGAIAWLVFEAIRLLVYLTIEFPMIGIPLDIIAVAAVIYFFVRRPDKNPKPFLASTSLNIGNVHRGDGFRAAFDRLRRFDPNFSEIVFTDFCYALYARSHEARERGAAGLDILSPYLGAHARNQLWQLNRPGLKDVKGIIVGSMRVVDVRGLETPVVQIAVVFEANYTELVVTNNAPEEMTYYVTERWLFERKRDVLSPTPAQATALHCPRCGAPLEKDSVGACAFCGTKIDSGEFQWYVRNVSLQSRDERGPLLTSDVPEVGTDLPSVVQPNFPTVKAEFEQKHPEFSWNDFQARAKLIFDELQAAWSSLNWERARPHETDNIFQMHQYWIDSYKRQGLQNKLDQCAIQAMQPVKIKEDAFYNSITLRIWAQGYDYTVDANNRVVSGSNTNLRHWTEYWTFIRNRQAKPIAARADLNCPNCGAQLQVNNAGVCEFCGGKITSGEFDWVLSRIEQDESYAG